MTWQNILGNIVANLIWVILAYAVIRIRKQFKADAALRQQQSDELAKIFSESDAAFEQVRPTLILMAQNILASRRTLLMENYFYTVICLITFMGEAISLRLEPKLWNGIITLFCFLSVWWCAYYTARTSLAVSLYEKTIVQGLKKSATDKVTLLRAAK